MCLSKNKLFLIFCLTTACNYNEETDSLLKKTGIVFSSQNAITINDTLDSLQNDYDKLAKDLVNMAYAINFTTRINFANSLDQFYQLKEQGDLAVTDPNLGILDHTVVLQKIINDLTALGMDVALSLNVFENISKQYSETLNKELICDQNLYNKAYSLAFHIARNSELKSKDPSSIDGTTLTAQVKKLIDPESFISDDTVTFLVEYVKDLQTFNSKQDLIIKKLNELFLNDDEYDFLSNRQMEMSLFNTNLEKTFMNNCAATQSDYLMVSAHLRKQFLKTISNQEINNLIVETSRSIDSSKPINYITATKYLLLTKGNELFLKIQDSEKIGQQVLTEIKELRSKYFDALQNTPYKDKNREIKD